MKTRFEAETEFGSLRYEAIRWVGWTELSCPIDLRAVFVIIGRITQGEADRDDSRSAGWHRDDGSSMSHFLKIDSSALPCDYWGRPPKRV
jgi:hypothetical protein